MPRKSLRPELNRIRGWVRDGRTDAWIAHQLEVTVQQIQAFKREQGLEPDGGGETATQVAEFDDEIDLRAEDDAQIAAELDAAQRAAEEAAAREAEEAAAREAEKAAARETAAQEAAARRAERAAAREAQAESSAEDDEEKPKRRRSRRGGRSKRVPGTPLEATFDHGEEGYGLWLDASVQDDPVYAEYWAGHRPVLVMIEEDQIVIRRAGEDGDEEDSGDE